MAFYVMGVYVHHFCFWHLFVYIFFASRCCGDTLF